MQHNSSQTQRRWRWPKLLLKILVTVACFWYVSGKIDFEKAGIALLQLKFYFLLAALLLFVASKLIAAYRLNIYFQDIGANISGDENLRMYWLGMFYNLFLPGSISGDAYKVILLKKKRDVPYKQASAAVLLDRLSGLLGLGILLPVGCYLGTDKTNWTYLLAAGSVAAILLCYFVVRRWFPLFRKNFLKTLMLGISVQITQVVCVYFILLALELDTNIAGYIFIFLISSVASILPLTIGGLGIREVVFLEGARLLNLQQESSVLISLVFYLITLIVSAMGAFYIFKSPLKEKR